MNRAIPAAIITAMGLGALASFKSTTGLPTKSAAAVVVPHSTVPAATAPPTKATTTPDTPPVTTPPTTHTSTTHTTPTTTSQSHTITGDAVDSRYGIVQVQVTLQGSTIIDIVAVQMPDSHQRSVEISQEAGPILHQETLQAQSAQIDIVSGATYTSQSYAQSLQSALDAAHG